MKCLAIILVVLFISVPASAFTIGDIDISKLQNPIKSKTLSNDMVKFTYVYTPEIPVVQAIVYNCRICPYAHIYEIFYLKDGVLFAYRRDNTGKVNTRIKDIPDKEAIIKELKSYKPEPGPRPEDRNDAI